MSKFWSKKCNKIKTKDEPQSWDDISEMWRVAKVLTRARGFSEDSWLEHNERITVRPNESLEVVRWHKAKEYNVDLKDIKIRVVE